MPRALLSLGSNHGDRQSTLASARQLIGAHVQIDLLRATGILENPAILYEAQADFLNQIVEVETSLTPIELLDALQAMETQLGRVRRFRYGPREIDLDILAYQGNRLNSDRLTLPHPGLLDREFLRELLAEWELSPADVAERY